MPPLRQRGYTLLEIAMVVAIISLLVGAAVPLVSGFTKEQRLRDTARELLVLAKTARAEAMTTGRPAAVVFEKKGFGILRPGDKEPSETFTLPGGMTYELKPFSADKALRPDGQVWLFQPTGLCEPLAVRLRDGQGWFEMEFDPLTADLTDESYYIP